ncbi:MAG TPA: J domain-containing protein, partial [Kofleriaceae bacterium]|nr:J domain-containing protein [Kofleriaceae bacterium]
MAWTVEELARWLDEVEPRMEQLDLFAWLGLTPDASPAEIQPAFHAVARTRHPDLFRTRLAAAELDRLVRAYARVTNAYAELRDPAACEAYARRLRPRPAQVARTRT